METQQEFATEQEKFLQEKAQFEKEKRELERKRSLQEDMKKLELEREQLEADKEHHVQYSKKPNQFKLYVVDVFKNHYSDFAGRATRKEFWMFFLFSQLLSLLLTPVAGLGVIVWLAALLPFLGLITRRLHDVGLSEWWALSALTIIGIPVLVVMLAWPAQKKMNEYGQYLETKKLDIY